MWGKTIIVCAAIAAGTMLAAQNVPAQGRAAPQGGAVQGVITAAGEDWIELQQADHATRRYLLPPPDKASNASAKTTRLEAVFHVAVGSEVDLLWQSTDGKPTAVGMIVRPSAQTQPAQAQRASTQPVLVRSPAEAKGGFVWAQRPPASRPSAEPAPAAGNEQPAEVASQSPYRWVATPWPTGAQENPDPFEQNWGSFMGFITVKGGVDWVEVRPVDGDNVASVRLSPAQVRPATATDSGLDVRVQEAIRRIPVGTRVQIFWIYADGKRVVKISPATQDGKLAVE